MVKVAPVCAKYFSLTARFLYVSLFGQSFSRHTKHKSTERSQNDLNNETSNVRYVHWALPYQGQNNCPFHSTSSRLRDTRSRIITNTQNDLKMTGTDNFQMYPVYSKYSPTRSKCLVVYDRPVIRHLTFYSSVLSSMLMKHRTTTPSSQNLKCHNSFNNFGREYR